MILEMKNEELSKYLIIRYLAHNYKLGTINKHIPKICFAEIIFYKCWKILRRF
jgi:hypothetical protein